MERSISPCRYPGCRDVDGNPRLTTEVICRPSRAHYRRQIDRVGWDYVTIHTTMPKPVATGPRIRTSSARSYGHPAEWASDTLAEIADTLNNTESSLRGWLGHAPAVHSGHSEPRRVALALNYLSNWFDELCTYPAAQESAAQIDDLHRRIYNALGHGNRETYLPVPCPACERKTLFRTLTADQDYVDCRSCGATITQERYDWYTRVLVEDTLTTGIGAACA